MEVTNKLDPTLVAREAVPEGERFTQAPASRRKMSKAQRVFASLLGTAIVVGAGFYVMGIGHESTDDAFVEGHVANISSRVSSQVLKVLVQDNQVVNEGDPIVELDRLELEAKLAAANADLAQAQAQLALTQKNANAALRTAKGALTQANSGLGSSQAALAQAKADVEAAKSRLKLADIELKRVEKLRKDGVVSASELDSRQSAFDTARASYDEVQARLSNAQQNINGSAGGIEAAEGRLASADTADVQVEASRARVDQAEAARKLAEANLSYATVKAPIRGVVSRRTVEAGMFVGMGTPLMAIVPREDVWIVANFKEDQVRDMKPGQPVTIEVDTYGRTKFQGKLDSIASATGSKFALLPPDNASGNFVKVVQRIPVKITIDGVNQNGGPILIPGMSADVVVNTTGK